MAQIYEVSGIGETTVVQLPLEDCEGEEGGLCNQQVL
jgi:hypothetical protein